MKKTFFAIAAFACATIISPVFAQEANKLNPGDALPAKDMPVKNVISNSDVTLNSKMAKNGLLVMFSCNTCPFVIKNEPIIQKTIQYAASHNVGMVVVNSNEAKRDGDDSYSEMLKYATRQHYSVPYLADDNSKLADLFGANHTPEVFLFNNKGILVYKGAMNDNPSDPTSYKTMYINNAIDAVVAGKEVTPKTTKSIGCSIKRKA